MVFRIIVVVVPQFLLHIILVLYFKQIQNIEEENL